MQARTMSVFRLYQLFTGVDFAGPIWAVFLLSRGLTLAQFGIVEASLHVGMLLAQVPTGALADAIGRRRMLVVAGAFTVAGQLGYVYAPGFALICVAGAVHGVSFALRTGTDEAYLFDSLAHDNTEAMFPRMLGGLWAVFQFAGAISYLLGGLIASYSRPLAFWLTAICAVLASCIAMQLPSDSAERAGHYLQTARRGVAALRHSPRLALLTLAWSVYWAAVTTVWYYAAPLLQSHGASDTVLGLVLGGCMLLSAGFSWIGGHMPGRVTLVLTIATASAVAAASFVLLSVSPGLVLPVIFLAIASGLPELVYVSLSTYLQHNTRSEFRATSMSIAEGCFSIQMLWLFPLVGLLSQESGFTAGFTVCAVLLSVAAVLFIASQRLRGLEPEALVPEAA